MVIIDLVRDFNYSKEDNRRTCFCYSNIELFFDLFIYFMKEKWFFSF